MHHIAAEDEMVSYLMTQRAIALHLPTQLYPNPQAATSSGAGSNNNNHNCSKMTPRLSQWRGRWGDGWSVVESRYQIAEGKNRNEKKEEWWELEKAQDKGQRARKSDDGGQVIYQRGERRSIFLSAPPSFLYISSSLPLWYDPLQAASLFFYSTSPRPFRSGDTIFFFLCS